MISIVSLQILTIQRIDGSFVTIYIASFNDDSSFFFIDGGDLSLI